MTTSPHELSRTRKRLLEAAGEVFAEHGYRAATVRDICLHASANVAAVNYHFRDKWALYMATIHEAADVAMRDFPILQLNDQQAPEKKLAAFVHSFLLRLVAIERPVWHQKVLARELIEPTPALDEMVNRMMRPTFHHLLGIVSGLLGPRVPQATLHRSAMSVIGQISFFCHSREAIARLMPEQTFTPDDVDELAKHITQFSLAAMHEIRSEFSASPKKSRVINTRVTSKTKIKKPVRSPKKSSGESK